MFNHLLAVLFLCFLSSSCYVVVVFFKFIFSGIPSERQTVFKSYQQTTLADIELKGGIPTLCPVSCISLCKSIHIISFI